MEGMKGKDDDIEEGSVICTDHPYRNRNPGGICAFCLQEKLGKLVSSPFPISVVPSSSSSTPSFRSDMANNGGSSSSSSFYNNKGGDCHYYYSRRARIPFILTQKKKKKKEITAALKRSTSTATPRRRHFLDVEALESDQKRGFWSFFYLTKSTPTRDPDHRKNVSRSETQASNGSLFSLPAKNKGKDLASNGDRDCESSSFERKVSRSRSVGCGSRSFSGDFFERISTGLGDCALRRVESQREGKPKIASNNQSCIKERVKCGGLFSGFMMTSSSSSSSSSSYYASSSVEDVNGKGPLAHGRSRSWGWAFASPMKAFSKPSSANRDSSKSNKDSTPNLAAIPSLLSARG